jgi:hypothetical protein
MCIQQFYEYAVDIPFPVRGFSTMNCPAFPCVVASLREIIRAFERDVRKIVPRWSNSQKFGRI